MNDRIVRCFIDFQIAEIDNDMIGICKSLVDWMNEVRLQINSVNIVEPEVPENFYKHHPHLPRIELRNNLREFLSHAVHKQSDIDEMTKLYNIYVSIHAAMYVYHLPVKSMVERSKEGKISREDAKLMLLEDSMSPNWIKEPSGTDYSAILL